MTVIHFVVIIIAIIFYLKEDWFMVSTDVRYYIKQSLLAIGLILGVELLLIGVPYLCGFDIAFMLEYLPVAEISVSHTPLFLIELQPIIGTITLTFFAPISVCALFYCLGFAPICYRNPWIAYLCVAVITLIPSIIDFLWRGGEALELHGYFVRLPIHLLACWSYQRTVNVWTPIFTVAVTNLLISVILCIIAL